MTANFKNTSSVGDILVRGKPVLANVVDKVSSVTIDMSVDQVTELTFVIDDPQFKLLKAGMFDKNTPVTYRGFPLTVAVIETGAGGGLGGLTIRCRPAAVAKLKKIRGKYVMKKVSAGTYIKAECARAGIPAPVIQSSVVKPQIARDVAQKGVRYDQSNYPSAWTTMQRLASELNYMLYEIGGVIYFGKPEWLVDKKPKVNVTWYSDDGKEPFSIPEFRESIDSTDIELSLELPLSRSGTVFPGYGITLSGFPKYGGTYFIRSVSYPLAGTGTISIVASTVKSPKAQKSGEQGNNNAWKPKGVGDGLIGGPVG